MFSATLRFNLDPFSDSTDQQIWDVLEAVTIKDFVEGLPNKLGLNCALVFFCGRYCKACA